MDSSDYYSDYILERPIHRSSFPTSFVTFNRQVPGMPERAIMKAYPTRTQIYRASDEFSNLKKGEISEVVCKPYYKLTKGNTVYLFLEYVTGELLEEATQADIHCNVEAWCLHLVECLSALHNLNVSHNNLAGHILNSHGSIRLIGFGRSSSFNCQRDVKSLGLLVLNLLVPDSLHHEEIDVEESQAKLNQLEFEERVSDKVKLFVRRALSSDNVSMNELRKVLIGANPSMQLALKVPAGWETGEDGSLHPIVPACLRNQQEEHKAPRPRHDTSSDRLGEQLHQYSEQVIQPLRSEVSQDLPNAMEIDLSLIRARFNEGQLGFEGRKHGQSSDNSSLQGVSSSRRLIGKCSMCNQRLATNFATLTCAHSFHTACIVRFLEDKCKVVRLYKELICPDCEASSQPISFDILKTLTLSPEVSHRLTLLQELLVPAKCRLCNIELMYPVLNTEFKAYRVTCHRCFKQSCSFCAKASTHWLGCEKAKKARKKWHLH
jgi:tRNA A-37 threonylcarbamoyl transferase component Bud32